MKKLLCILTAAMLLVLALAGCSAKSSGNLSEGYDSSASAESAPQESPTGDGSDKYIGGLNDASYVENDRKLIYTSDYTIETKTFDEHYKSIIEAVENAGGFVSYENTHGTKPEVYGDPGRYAEFTFRIPTKSFNNFLTTLDSVGSVVAKNRSADDVTESYYDNEARIELYEQHYQKLLEYLDKATQIDDIIAIESEINEILYIIDDLKGNKRYMDDQIEYCTANVFLREVVDYSEIAASDTVGLECRRGKRNS